MRVFICLVYEISNRRVQLVSVYLVTELGNNAYRQRIHNGSKWRARLRDGKERR